MHIHSICILFVQKLTTKLLKWNVFLHTGTNNADNHTRIQQQNFTCTYGTSIYIDIKFHFIKWFLYITINKS